MAAALGACTDMAFFFVSVPLAWKMIFVYGLIPLFEIFVCLRPQSARAYARAMLLLYLVILCVGGFLNWLYDQLPFLRKHGYHLMTLICAVTFLGAGLQKASGMIRRERVEKQCIWLVSISVNGKQIHCRGLMDTGNSLYDPISQKPVLILEREQLTKNRIELRASQYRIIPYHSIGVERDYLEGFIANEVCLVCNDEPGESQRMKRQNVVIGIYDGTLSKDGAYQIILHPML